MTRSPDYTTPSSWPTGRTSGGGSRRALNHAGGLAREFGLLIAVIYHFGILAMWPMWRLNWLAKAGTQAGVRALVSGGR
jgi:hypothetical protein